MRAHPLDKLTDPKIPIDSIHSMPILPAVRHVEVLQLLPWTPGSKEYNGTLHFWIDDYKFNAMVTYPKRYVRIVRKYHNVIQPDHSSYGDWNYNVQRYQQFLRQWVGAVWTHYGDITVIPNIHIPPTDDPKWDFFWAGVPTRSIVAISALNISDQAGDTRSREWFLNGFETMMKKLDPVHVIYYGGRLQVLEEKWGHLLTRFSRHSFIGQHNKHQKYTFQDIASWEDHHMEEQFQEHEALKSDQHLHDKSLPQDNKLDLLVNKLPNKSDLKLNDKVKQPHGVLENGQQDDSEESLKLEENSKENENLNLLQRNENSIESNSLVLHGSQHKNLESSGPKSHLPNGKHDRSLLKPHLKNDEQLPDKSLKSQHNGENSMNHLPDDKPKSVKSEQSKHLSSNSNKSEVKNKSLESTKNSYKLKDSKPQNNDNLKKKRSNGEKLEFLPDHNDSDNNNKSKFKLQQKHKERESLELVDSKVSDFSEKPDEEQQDNVPENNEQHQAMSDNNAISNVNLHISKRRSLDHNDKNNDKNSQQNNQVEPIKNEQRNLLKPQLQVLPLEKQSDQIVQVFNSKMLANSTIQHLTQNNADEKTLITPRANYESPLSKYTNYCIILNGHKNTLQTYMYLKAKGYNIQSVYLKHDWVFPDIEEYIMRYSDVVVEVDRSLSDVLQKRGWPSMRGGNKQWHTRELELCVDKYLRETQSTEILCFDADISKSALKIRQKRKTPFCLPLYSESLSINDYTVSTCLVLPELRDQSETHYLIPIKGLMYSSLRPKFELEMFYMMNIEYKQRYETVRNMKSIEGVWDRLLELDDSIESDIKLFSGYSTLLDLLYEFDGRNLSRMIEEYEEYPTGRFITLHEQRVKTIQRAITEQNWLWALDHRSKQRWYTVKPIEFSKSQKTVRVITKDGMKHEKFLPVTNLYNRPAENYNGSL